VSPFTVLIEKVPLWRCSPEDVAGSSAVRQFNVKVRKPPATIWSAMRRIPPHHAAVTIHPLLRPAARILFCSAVQEDALPCLKELLLNHPCPVQRITNPQRR
jgi:hypothetical protein